MGRTRSAVTRNRPAYSASRTWWGTSWRWSLQSADSASPPTAAAAGITTNGRRAFRHGSRSSRPSGRRRSASASARRPSEVEGGGIMRAIKAMCIAAILFPLAEARGEGAEHQQGPLPYGGGLGVENEIRVDD